MAENNNVFVYLIICLITYFFIADPSALALRRSCFSNSVGMLVQSSDELWPVFLGIKPQLISDVSDYLQNFLGLVFAFRIKIFQSRGPFKLD
jgi:hypothetical protein